MGEVMDKLDGLNGLDITELNSFIQKKQWIDEKIKFLQDLPPIGAIDPLPPSKSPTSFEELQSWLNEHELIEKEVSLYDMGDLSKLKEFAKSASKNNLSESDAKYIEITLTTLLSVDKLFHLLRQRKKCLNLLSYRLKWESQVASAWIEHRKILTDLPLFLSKARWTAPSELLPRTRKTSSPESLLLHQDNNSLSTLPPSPTTASPRTLSVSLASLIDPSSSPPRSSNSTSAMSRTMRSEVLSLSLASQKSAIHSLIQSVLPNTASILDKLIDTSPIPLPDAFLDEQEKLEESSKSLTEGLAGFLSATVTQWRHADEVFWCTRGLEVEGNNIMRDLEEAVLKLPDRTKLKSFEERLTIMERDLKELEEKRWSNGFLPLPIHPSVKDQEEENVKLVKVLENNLIRAKDYLGRSREAVEGYQFAVTSLEESREVRKEMEKKTVELNEFLIQLSELDGKPDLTTSKCLIPSELSISFLNQFTTIATSIQSTISSIQPLLLQSSKVLVNLNKAGIDPNVRQAVRETMAGLSSIKEKVVETLRKEELSGRKLKAAQEFENAVNLARKRMSEVEEILQKNILDSRWTNRSTKMSQLVSEAVDIQLLQLEVEEFLATPSSSATQLLARSNIYLYSHLQSLSTTLLPLFDSIQRQSDLFMRIQLQREEASSIMNDFERFENEVSKLAAIISGSVETPGIKDLNYQEEISTLEASFNLKITSIFKDITFLHSSMPLNSLLSAASVPSTLLPYLPAFLRLSPSTLISPFDLSEQDDLVRNAINLYSAAIGGSIEELKRQNKVLQHQIATSSWDSETKALEKKLEEFENENVDFNESLDDSALEVFVSQTSQSQSIIASIRSELESLSHSLTNLQADPVSFNPLFNSHSDLRSILSSLSQRHQLTQDKFSSILSLASKLVTARDTAVLERQRLAEIEAISLVDAEKNAALKAEEEKRILKLEEERLEILEAEKLQEAQEIEQKNQQEVVQTEALRLEDEAIVAATLIHQDLDDVFGPIVVNPFPIVDGEEEDDIEKSPIMQFSSRLSNIMVDHWQDQQIFYQLPSMSDAQRLAEQLAPLEAQLQDIDCQDDSSDYDSVKLELRRKSLAIAQINCLAQFKNKVELADDAFSNLLTSIDNATPGMVDNFKTSDALDFQSSVMSIPEALRIAGNAITVVRKHSIPLLEDSRVLSHIRRLELTFDDMSGLIEDLTPRRSFSSASASSTYSNSRIPTPSRSIRSASASSSHNPLSNSSSSRPPSSLFSSSSSTFTRNGSKPSLQSFNTPNQRKRHSSSASSAVSSIVSSTPRPSRIHSNPNATPRAFAVPSITKNSFGMSFGQSTASRKSAVLSPTPSRRDRASSIQNRNGLDTSPAFSHPTGASSRRSTFTSSPTLSPSTLFTKTKQRYKSNPNSVIDIALGKVINDFPGIVFAKPAENNSQSESGMYWIGDINPKLYFCRILRSKNIFLRTGGGWLNLIEFLNKNYSQAPDSPGSPNITRWIAPATARSQLSLSTSSVSLSRSLSAGLSPRIVSDNILSTPRKNPIAPPPWKF